MKIIQVPGETIKFNYGTVDKYAVVFQDEVVYVGSEPQCRRFVYYMEGAKAEEILGRKQLRKDLVS